MCIVGEHVVSGSKGEIDPERISRELIRFIGRMRERFEGVEVRYVFADSEAQYLINGIRRSLSAIRDTVTVTDCAKKPICDRIAFVNSLMHGGRFFILEDCRVLRAGLSSAVWDEKSDSDKRLDNFTSDIDILDAMEYSIERYMSRLMSPAEHGGKSKNNRKERYSYD